jgi:hypothetical protein
MWIQWIQIHILIRNTASYIYNKCCTKLIFSNYFDISCFFKFYFPSAHSCFSKRIQRRRQLGDAGGGAE